MGGRAVTALAPAHLNGRRVGIAGLGVSGQAAAEALAGLGARLVLIDDHATSGQAVPSAAVDVASLELLVVSPGWAPGTPLLAAARAAGLPIWSEVELAWRLRANPLAHWLVATGTNGKTTTVQMLRSILLAAGHTAEAVGNVGTPLTTAVLNPDTDVFAVELSSFQLHHSYSLQPWASAVLNVSPDHIDWHGSFQAYSEAKGRVFNAVQSAQIFNADDPAAVALVTDQADRPGPVRSVGFTLGAPRLGQVGLLDGYLMDRAFYDRRYRHALPVVPLSALDHLSGPDGRLAPHLVADALAAMALALAQGAEPDQISQGLASFELDGHRLAEVGQLNGVRFVDDSKATNAHAAAAALAAFPSGSVVWIAGGLAKGARFEQLVAARGDKLKAVVLIGVDNHELTEALASCAPDVPVQRIGPGPNVMARAVARAAALAEVGDVVLLAPASASTDQFSSYAERGRLFAAAVGELAGQPVGVSGSELGGERVGQLGGSSR
jgi:UDP-N-acetylmuramoylalanine--D-glutamate ligase